MSSTDNFTDVFKWDTPPNRDEVLSLIYDSLNTVSSMQPFSVDKQILIKDTRFYLQTLEDALRKHLKMVIEDSEWHLYEAKPLLLSIPNHHEMDEDLMLPIFSGKSFQMAEDEEVSLKIFLMDSITPIRIHFKIISNETYYYLKLIRITAD